LGIVERACVRDLLLASTSDSRGLQEGGRGAEGSGARDAIARWMGPGV